MTSLEGPIVLGGVLKLQVPSAPGRVFKPKVTTFEQGKKMVWSDGLAPMFKGVRTYSLAPDPNGSTVFSMHEEFSGLMLPMIKGSLPTLLRSSRRTRRISGAKPKARRDACESLIGWKA